MEIVNQSKITSEPTRRENFNLNGNRLLLTDNLLIGIHPEEEELLIDYSPKHKFKLPLSAIYCLIYSYLNALLENASQLVHNGNYDSAIDPQAYEMLNCIIKELNRHNFGGRKIVYEVYEQCFAERFKKLKEEESKILATEQERKESYMRRTVYFVPTVHDLPF